MELFAAIPAWTLLALAAAALAAVGWFLERKSHGTPKSPRLKPALQEHTPSLETAPFSANRPPVLSFLRKLIAVPRLKLSFELALFLLALLVYLSIRLYAITDFPIYFFSDEAVNTLLASDFVRDQFHSYEGEFFPTFFKNADRYNLSTSVYLQVLPVLLFGKSIAITRATAALVTLLAAISVALILRHIFQIRMWWSGVLLLSLVPVWFLHSRTAFETSLMVSFYAACLYFYLLYRLRSPRSLYAAILMGALAFYTYSPARIILPVTALLFLLSDAPYHWQQRKTLLAGLILALLCALPYLRFTLNHPEALVDQLVRQTSYWVEPIPLPEKLGRLLLEYSRGLNPVYWYLPNDQEIARHTYRGAGHMLWAAAPLALAGFILVLRNISLTQYRAVLLAILAIPSGTALIKLGVTRVLAMVVPVTLLAALGLAWVVDWFVQRRGNTSPRIHYQLSTGVFIALLGANIAILTNALVNAPTWYTDYTMIGIQYGAKQVYSAIHQEMDQNPGVQVVLSPTWANGADILSRFFFEEDPPPLQLASIETYLHHKEPHLENTLLVLPPQEYQKALASGKFDLVEIYRILNYPNGEPGFYFLRLQYAGNFDAILAAEREERRRPLEGEVNWQGETLRVRYSRLDIGEIQSAFDGNPHTMLRTLEDNPLVIEIDFPQVKTIAVLDIIIGSTEAQVTLELVPADGSVTQFYTGLLVGSVEKPLDTLVLPHPVQALRAILRIQDTRQEEPGNVHVWEIVFR